MGPNLSMFLLLPPSLRPQRGNGTQRAQYSSSVDTGDWLFAYLVPLRTMDDGRRFSLSLSPLWEYLPLCVRLSLSLSLSLPAPPPLSHPGSKSSSFLPSISHMQRGAPPPCSPYQRSSTCKSNPSSRERKECCYSPPLSVREFTKRPSPQPQPAPYSQMTGIKMQIGSGGERKKKGKERAAE